MRIIWIFLAFTSMLLAILGALLPILPGWIFFGTGIACLKKASPKFHRWLNNTKIANWLRANKPNIAKMLLD